MLGISVQLQISCAEPLALLWRDRLLKELDAFLLNFGAQSSRDRVFFSYLKKDHCTHDFHMTLGHRGRGSLAAGYSGV